MNRKEKKAFKALQAMNPKSQVKMIQAMGIEGINFDVAMSSLLDGSPITSIGGTQNLYRSYSAQVTETYRKYRGQSEWGNVQVKTVVDGRTAFIAGESLSVVLGKDVPDNYGKLFDKFMDINKLRSSRLFDLTKQTEMAGYAIATLIKTSDKFENIPLLGLVPTYGGKVAYQPIIGNSYNVNTITGFTKLVGGEKEAFKIDNFIYFRTGGDGVDPYDFGTKVGAVLNECENYDKASKDMRRVNHIGARITPDFKTNSKSETTALTEWLKANKWEHGQARIGTAEFTYKTPGTGPLDNLKSEMVTNVKTVSGETGMPIHWFGWVDQMSNRSTAAELYASVNNATIMERNIIAEGMKQAFIEMQLMYIDSGGTLIKEATTDFEVKLPLIDFGKFKETIDAYSLLYADDVISLETYRNKVPDIDPIFEAKQVEAEQEDQPTVTETDIDIDDDESDEGDE